MTKQKSTTDDLVSSMAKQLLQGVTMTGESCPNCNTPIFRNKEGTLYCPKCNRPVIIVDNPQDIPPEPTMKPENTESQAPQVKPHGTWSHLQNVLLRKIAEVTNTISAVSDPAQLRTQLLVLEDLLRIYSNTFGAHPQSQ